MYTCNTWHFPLISSFMSKAPETCHCQPHFSPVALSLHIRLSSMSFSLHLSLSVPSKRCWKVMTTMWSPASSSVATASSAALTTTRWKSGQPSQERYGLPAFLFPVFFSLNSFLFVCTVVKVNGLKAYSSSPKLNQLYSFFRLWGDIHLNDCLKDIRLSVILYCMLYI